MDRQMLERVIWPVVAFSALVGCASLPQDKLPPQMALWVKQALSQNPVISLYGSNPSNNIATRHALRKQGFVASSFSDNPSFVLKVKQRQHLSRARDPFCDELFFWGGRGAWYGFGHDSLCYQVWERRRFSAYVVTQTTWTLETLDGDVVWQGHAYGQPLNDGRNLGIPYNQADKLARQLRLWIEE